MRSRFWAGTLLAGGLAAAGISCAGRSTTGDAAPVTYESHIRALVEKRCAECHGPKSPSMAEFDKDKARYKELSLGPRYDTYENLMVVVNGSDIGALMRRLDDGTNTKDGKPGNMHENLGEDSAELAANLALFRQCTGGYVRMRGD